MGFLVFSMCGWELGVRYIGYCIGWGVSGMEGVAVIMKGSVLRTFGVMRVEGAGIRSDDGILCARNVLYSADVRSYDGILCTCDVLCWGWVSLFW